MGLTIEMVKTLACVIRALGWAGQQLHLAA